jgi:thiamine-phosphate pyrophosphorylase
VPTPDFDLYLVTDRTQTRGRDFLWVLERALQGGVRAVQLREKDLNGKDLFQLADKTRELCDRYQAQLFVNDRIDVALAVDAAGVQLGKTSIPIETSRLLLGTRKLIGYSAHSLHIVKGFVWRASGIGGFEKNSGKSRTPCLCYWGNQD